MQAVQYMVAMVVMQHAIYRALDCFDLPTHWATSISIMQFILNTSYILFNFSYMYVNARYYPITGAESYLPNWLYTTMIVNNKCKCVKVSY